MPRGARAVKTKFMGGKVVSAKSKTGDPQCSQAMSAWQNIRHGNPAGMALEAAMAILGRCRSKARALKQASQHRSAGNEAKAQHLEHRAQSGGPVSAKDRLAKAKAILEARKPGGPAWAMSPREYRNASDRLKVNASGTGGDSRYGMGRATSEKGFRAIAEARQKEQDRLSGGTTVIRMGQKYPGGQKDATRAAVLAGAPVPAGKLRRQGIDPARPLAAPGRNTAARLAKARELRAGRAAAIMDPNSPANNRAFEANLARRKAETNAKRNTTRQVVKDAAKESGSTYSEARKWMYRKPSVIASERSLHEHAVSAASSVPASLRSGDKVFLHHAHAEYQKQGGKLSLDEFKRQLASNPDARRHMSRADLVQAFKPEDVKASQAVYDVGGGVKAEFNFIRVPNTAKPAPSLREQAAAHRASPDVIERNTSRRLKQGWGGGSEDIAAERKRAADAVRGIHKQAVAHIAAWKQQGVPAGTPDMLAKARAAAEKALAGSQAVGSLKWAKARNYAALKATRIMQRRAAQLTR